MRSAKNWLALLICLLFYAPIVPAQDAPPPAAKTSSDVTIIIQQEQVRFAAPRDVAEMRLQVFDQTGELVYDSGAILEPELNWPLQNSNGEMLKSGLYAYALSIKDVTGKEASQEPGAARVRRGHFIVDRAKDQDGKTDRLWVTSQNEGGVGAELTVASNKTATVAGAAISERTIKQRAAVAKRDAADRKVEAENQKEAGQATAAITAGTVGRLAKFTTADEVGDSIVSEVNGNIGIGITAPKHRLAIAGTPAWTSNNWGGALELTNGSALAWQANNAGQRAGIGHTNGGTFFFRTNSDPGTAGSPAIYDMTITDAGNVGIGTTTPESPLHVHGHITSTGPSGGLFFRNRQTTTPTNYWAWYAQNNASHLWQSGAGNLLSVTPNGNVGIGTETPATKLHVQSAGFAEATIRSTNERAILALTNTLGPSAYTWTVESGVRGQPGVFGIWNRVVSRAGLEIDGNLRVYVKELQITGGADFAENFDVRAEAAAAIQPGLVVTIDPAEPGKLALSRRAYDRRVAGIISGAGDVKPGMMMGAAGTLADGQHPVALSGRVYVWADAARGAIRPGDLLTTSNTPGHAMRAGNAAKAQGAIIGKAMTGLKSGKGLVLVLVTLQ